MNRALRVIGVPIVIAAWLLALRLVWEQTVWTWARGPQMVGFSLMHSGAGVILLLAVCGGVLWALAALIYLAVKKSFGDKMMIGLLLGYALAWGVASIPYGFWQRTFISKFSPEQSVDLFTYAAATGDPRTVEAFIEHGVNVNAQGDNGTALHGAAVEGNLAIIEFLIAHGADVNAINPYGDSPLANAMEARSNAAEAQALLKKHGGILIQGSEEQRSRAIREQVRRQIEESDQRKEQ